MEGTFTILRAYVTNLNGWIERFNVKYVSISILLIFICLLICFTGRTLKAEQKPSLSQEELFFIESLAEADATRNQLIDYIEDMLRTVKSKKLKMRLYLKLLKAYSGKYVSMQREEVDQYSDRFDRWRSEGRKGARPKANHAASNSIRRKVIKLGKKVIKSYPKFSQLDEVYFLIAYALQMQGKAKAASYYHKMIIKKYPKSSKRVEAHFAMGEYYFDVHQFKRSLRYYKVVAQYVNHSLYVSAWYKIAWCFYNLHKYRQSLTAFKRVVELSSNIVNEDGQEQQYRKKYMRFKEESLRDMVLVYAEYGKVSEAREYFYSVGGEKFFRNMLLRYGEVLIRNGKIIAGVKAIKEYIKMEPYDPLAPDNYRKIIEALQKLANKARLFEALEEYVILYNEKSDWVEHHRKDKALVSDTVKTVRRLYFNQVESLHQSAQKHQDRRKYRQAFNAYQVFINHYPNSPETYKAYFFAAEIRFHEVSKGIRNKRKARAAYIDSSNLYYHAAALNRHGKYFKPASKTMLLASTIAFEDEWKKIRRRQYKYKGEELPLSAEAANFLQKCRIYIGWKIKGKETKQCRLDMVEILLKLRRFEQAEPGLWLILSHYTRQKEGIFAGKFLLRMYKGHPDLPKTIQRMAGIKGVMSTSLGKEIALYMQQMFLAEAKNLEERGEYTLAAQKYLQYHDKNRKLPTADMALYNAALNFEKARKVDLALKQYWRLLRLHPKSKLVAKVYNRIPPIEESLLYFGEAASSYLKMAKSTKNNKTLLFNSVLLFYAVNSPKIQSVVEIILRKYPRTPEALESLIKLFRYFENNNMVTQSITIGKQWVGRLKVQFSKAFLRGKIGQAYRKKGQYSKSLYHFKELIKIGKRTRLTGEVRNLLVEASFRVAVANIYLVDKVRLKASRLNQTVDKKGAALTKIDSRFQEVLRLNDAKWGVASLFKLGELFKRVAKQLDNAPIPSSVAAHVRQQIRRTIKQNITLSLEQKSKAYFERGLQIAFQENIYTEYTGKLKANQVGHYNRVSNSDLMQPSIFDAVLFDQSSVGALFR